jgi:hypothetical protein
MIKHDIREKVACSRKNLENVPAYGGLKLSAKLTGTREATRQLFWHEQAKSECDWMVMSSVFVTNKSSCFFLLGKFFSKWETLCKVFFKVFFKVF